MTIIDNNEIIAADFGNSRAKIKFKNEYFSINYNDVYHEDFISFVQKLNQKYYTFIYSTVNNSKANLFLSKLPPELELINADYLVKSQKIIDFSLISGMGLDRKLGLLGAVELSKPPVITIDFGTAVTINFVDENFVCQGGVILPGPYTQLKSLASETENLSGFEFIQTDNITGSNTKAAISIGILDGITGSVKFILDRIILKYDIESSVNIYYTGGSLNLFESKLKLIIPDAVFVETLVVDGILSLLK